MGGGCCVLLATPVLFGDGFRKLKVSEEKTVYFLSVIPLYEEEMNFKLKHGTDPLVERLARAGISELLDVNRKNVCKA